MDFLQLIGRIMFSGLLVGSALGHFTATDAMAGFAESRGVKPARLLVLLSGTTLIAAAVAIVLGIWMDLALLLLAVQLIATAVLMHPFWRDPAEARMNSQTQFLKDIAIAGASLMLFGFYARAGEVIGLTLTGPVF